MNIKRILSTALVVVMLFTTLIAAVPFAASAAYSPSSATANANIPEGYEEANLNQADLEAYLEEYVEYDFASAGEMLNYELERGYLYYTNSSGMQYTMFVNKYTGFIYYVNNVTGQILTSNPINPKQAPGVDDKQTLMSQIVINFAEAENSAKAKTYTSFRWAAMRSQISVSAISGGFRVNYTLGDTAARFLLPGWVKADAFEESILKPMFEQFALKMEEYCSEKYPNVNFSFFDNPRYAAYEYECISYTAARKYFSEMQTIYQDVLKRTSPEYKQLNAFRTDINKIMQAYSAKIPAKYIDKSNYKDTLETMYKDYPVTKDGEAIYVYSGSKLPEAKRPLANIIKEYCPDYTFSLMYKQEKECGYEDDSAQQPVFRCALEYTFNSDNTLSVRLPASSITFDETVYILNDIIPLQYFGGADMTNDGYVFYPDGSGTVINFSDFYGDAKTVGIVLEAPMYGLDYCYSKINSIAGISHREQVTMPVYGVVNEVKANPATTLVNPEIKTVTNGYFAIIEEGSALANLMVMSGGSSHRFIGAYAYYTPYPSDTYDLSETLSVGSLGIYKIVSDSKYTGSYVTRYVMLADDELGVKYYGENGYYSSDYVGMATCYRDYLKENGTLKAIENFNEDLPLYIEVLGAMDITAKFLSFPITKNVALTTFNDVATIYDELSKCEELVVQKVEEYKQLAEAEEDAVQKYQYEKQAERYAELIGNIQNIKNINFKLTGFANGGLKSTYPVKLKWVKACGGKSGFKNLLAKADAVNASGEGTFNIYPDFDFMYINKTGTFDGISVKETAAMLVDSRYASMQTYNSVVQEFETVSSLVVNPGVLESLYNKFNSKYSSYGNKNISVSSMGVTLNSNFDKSDAINREDALGMVESVLDTMVNTNGYNVMTDTGNVYALKYASHILNAPVDSSHHRYTSYTVPFMGMVLHSYVNYTGEPINYSGSPAYDRLRAIESGAALYYIVCFRNTSYMKNDEDLNKYYGIDYHNWFDLIAENYKILNDYVGDLQKYEIVDHDILKAEREVADDELATKFIAIEEELLVLLEKQIINTVDEALAGLKGNSQNYDKRIKIVISRDSIIDAFAGILNISKDRFDVRPSADELSFSERINALADEFEAEYKGASDAANTVTVNFEFSLAKMLTMSLDDQLSDLVGKYSAYDPDIVRLNVNRAAIVSRFAKILDKDVSEIETLIGAEIDAVIAKYTSVYDGYHYGGQYDPTVSIVLDYNAFVYIADSYVTESCALDGKDYIVTDFTVDNGNVTMVTYKCGDSVVRFILNYNNYKVNVRLGETESYTLDAYGFVRI